MGGLKGQDRTPAASQRVRRNATNLASEFSQVIGDGLTLSGAGIISVDIVTSGGLKFTSGQLEVDEPNVDHDALNNFVADEHIDWTGTTENFDTSGTITSGDITIFNPSPILIFKDSTSAGIVARGIIEWRDLNHIRLGYFGNSSEGNDDLLWKNESSDGHIQVQTTGAGEFQIFANVDLGSNDLTTTGLGTFGNLDVDTLNLNANVISDSTGTISFDDDKIATTGHMEVGNNVTPDSGIVFHLDELVASPGGEVTGLRFNARVSDTPGAHNVFGLQGNAAFQNLNANPTGILYGGSFQIVLSQSTGRTVPDTRALYTKCTNVLGGVITNYYGLYVANGSQVFSGSVVNQYGIYIEDQTYGTGSNYAIFSLGGDVELTDGNLTTTGGITAGASTFGDGGATDYSQFEADGTLEFNGAATVWGDYVTPLGPNNWRGVANNPTLTQLFTDGAGSQGVYAFVFSDGNEAIITIQMPHNWKEGTTIQPHIHFMCRTDVTPADNFGIEFEYNWANLGDDFAANSTLTTVDISTGVNTNNNHRLEANVTVAGIDGTGKTISSILLCRIKRVAADSDNYLGGIAILDFDVHYEIDTIGSRQELVK